MCSQTCRGGNLPPVGRCAQSAPTFTPLVRCGPGHLVKGRLVCAQNQPPYTRRLAYYSHRRSARPAFFPSRCLYLTTFRASSRSLESIYFSLLFFANICLQKPLCRRFGIGSCLGCFIACRFQFAELSSFFIFGSAITISIPTIPRKNVHQK